MVNQCTKFEIFRFTRLECMNGGAKCRKWGGLRELKVMGNATIRQSAYDFLFDFNRNCVSIFYRFRDIAGYLSKVANFTYPTCIWRLRRGLPRSNFAEIFGVRKLESLGYPVVFFCMIPHLAVLVEHRLVTDRQTDTGPASIPRMHSIAR